MSAKSEKPKNKKIKLVGGGFRYTRQSNTGKRGGSIKSIRRGLRKQAKDKKLTIEQRRVLKKMVQDSLRAKNAKKGN